MLLTKNFPNTGLITKFNCINYTRLYPKEKGKGKWIRIYYEFFLLLCVFFLFFINHCLPLYEDPSKRLNGNVLDEKWSCHRLTFKQSSDGTPFNFVSSSVIACFTNLSEFCKTRHTVDAWCIISKILQHSFMIK